ncbi:MAG: bifunctional 2-polyprenyl-6-hydroxyphenol methylase/3-demethylubiquinol 3-O-methyltransferase UbiG [Methylophilaceae bacterium]|nr:bifunctional 2-polyprenyl-6-hydroxyphenol methylase/3-demethylubiquinol 3-O-methyltransferase UbiG [Methylophilaceae bacterium]
MANKDKKNIDQAEVEKFNLLAHKWWDPTSEFKPLHEINPLRVNFIKSKVDLSGKELLDVGCGGGILSESMAKEGAHVTAIDQGENVIKIAQLHTIESKLDINYKKLNIEDLLKKTNEKFDVITCLEMLEHVPDPASIVRACKSLLKPNGRIFFSTINRNPKAFLFAIIGAEYILGLLPKGTHSYEKFITPSELMGWSEEEGLRFIDIVGMTYNPISKEYSLGNDTSVNYLVEVGFSND